MEEVTNNSIQCHLATAEDLPVLWELFQEYHCCVSHFEAEAELPLKKTFFNFWNPSNSRIGLIVTKDNISVGFSLLQILESSHYPEGRCLELGAIFTKKRFRHGNVFLHLWMHCIKEAKKMKLPIVSEVSNDNHHVIKLLTSYAKHCKTKNIRVTLSRKSELEKRWILSVSADDERNDA